MQETILVMGGDGYLGWPLTMKLALQHPNYKIVVIDTEWRRCIHTLSGYNSIIPISTPTERIALFNKRYGLHNIYYMNADVQSAKLEDIIKTERPSVIYHLAQQPSASYSMMGAEEALFTLKNNEGGNMRLLWAVKQYVPDAHIIKLGSMGEYSKGGIDIPEGHFYPEYNGRVAEEPMPFPKDADDIYHISKINDTNYVAMACRQWNLRITDVMQSTVYGVITDEMAGDNRLLTRFDYDECFGTVVNRFMAQAVMGHPLTVFGTGQQRTGLMPLRDVVTSMARFTTDLAQPGVHRVINHVTHSSYSINELAYEIQTLAADRGIQIAIDRSYNPRGEGDQVKKEYDIATSFIDRFLDKSCLATVVNETLQVLEQYKHRILPAAFKPQIKWKHTGEPKLIDHTLLTPDAPPELWETFRRTYFPSRGINLNPGTLGTLSLPVKEARQLLDTHFQIQAFPLGIYQQADKKLLDVQHLIQRIWPMQGYEVVVTPSITQLMNLLSLNILRKLYAKASPPFKIVTTAHEHSGGIGCFKNLPEYEVYVLPDSVWQDAKLLQTQLLEIQPHVAFYSSVYFDTAQQAPVDLWCSTIRANVPNCTIIVDVAQALAIHRLPNCDADIMVASTHKWLHGPHGGGIMFIKPRCAVWLGGIFWDQHTATVPTHIGSFKSHGGQDFYIYAEILEALKLHSSINCATIWQRSCALQKVGVQYLLSVLEKHHIVYHILSPVDSPVLSLSISNIDIYPFYQYLNDELIHVKCIKHHMLDGQEHHILRLGFPYYESTDRIKLVVQEIDKYLSSLNVLA